MKDVLDHLNNLDDEETATMACNKCGAYDLEPDEPCDCYDDSVVGGVPISAVPAMSRDEFYAMLAEDDQYTGLVDPDDFENILIATILSLDMKYQELLGHTAKNKAR